MTSKTTTMSRLGKAFAQRDREKSRAAMVQFLTTGSFEKPTIEDTWESEFQSRDAMRRTKPRKSEIVWL